MRKKKNNSKMKRANASPEQQALVKDIFGDDDDEGDDTGSSEPGKKQQKVEPPAIELHPHEFSDVDLSEVYYRIGYRGIQVSDAKSAMQKEIRRGNEVAACYWAMVLLASFKVENLMNRLLVIASEDVAVANKEQVIMAESTQCFYRTLRDLKGKKAGAWKCLRNDVELRTRIARLVIALCRAPKTRITDHMLSLLCSNPIGRGGDEDEYTVLPADPKADVLLSGFNTVLHICTLMSDVKRKKYDEALERRAFDELRKVLRPSAGWEELENKRAVFNFQKAKMTKAFELMLYMSNELSFRGISPQKLYRCVEALKNIGIYRMKKTGSVEHHVPKGLPGKVELCHALLFFTRPESDLDFLGHDASGDDQKLGQIATDDYAAFIRGDYTMTPPDYSLDRHTSSNRGVDKSLAGFFEREHKALHPVKNPILYDPYYAECLALMKVIDAKK